MPSRSNAKQKSVIVGINTKTFSDDVEIPASYSAILSGPVTIQNINVEGALNVVGNLSVTANLVIGENGTLNLTG